jgi:AraC-like DNA-binding protein
MTAVKYIHTRRIIEAEKQLLYTDRSTDAIAAAVGFTTMQHFYRVFREVTGTSPGEYREKNKIVV